MPDWKTADPVALHACATPDKVACVDLASDRKWTYREFDMSIDRMAAWLDHDGGIRPGERIATIARNSADLLILQQSAMRIGAIFVPVNWRLSRQEQAQILADCSPTMLVTDEDPGSIYLPAGCQAFSVATLAAGAAVSRPFARRELPPCDAPIIILYTSGTSGKPKGVLITGRNAFATAVNFGVIGQVGHDSVFLCDTPMFHVIGLITSIQSPLLQGGRVLISAGFDPVVTNDRLADEGLGVTHYFCVPQMAAALKGTANFEPQRWRTLKALFTGGAPNPPAMIRWWLEQGIKMVDGYGMTEAGTLLGMPLSRARIAEKAGSSGLPPPALSMRLVDDAGQVVEDDAVGEILVSGPSVTPGYWARPEETARAFTADGWFRTGDLARRDADGFVTIVDRKKDMFISGGENVYPVEVEAVLIAHPGVREAAVIGIADAKWGEVGRAFIVRIEGAAVTAEGLAEHCANAIARYKVPKEFVFIDSLPRSGAGKILKNLLRNGDAGQQ
jgi:fatty-acyl-CoA synthase